MIDLNFTVDGKTYTHNERQWRVCTNRHPSTNGDPWGWIEGPDANLTWSGSSAHAVRVAAAHNDWLIAQEPPPLRAARLCRALAAHDAEIASIRARLARAEAEAARVRAELASLDLGAKEST